MLKILKAMMFVKLIITILINSTLTNTRVAVSLNSFGFLMVTLPQQYT